MAQTRLPMALFTSEDGHVRLQLKLEDKTLWLTQKPLAELFEKSPKTISEHLKNIYDEGELAPGSTIRKFRTVAREGRREVERTDSIRTSERRYRFTVIDFTYGIEKFVSFNEYYPVRLK